MSGVLIIAEHRRGGIGIVHAEANETVLRAMREGGRGQLQHRTGADRPPCRNCLRRARREMLLAGGDPCQLQQTTRHRLRDDARAVKQGHDIRPWLESRRPVPFSTAAVVVQCPERSHRASRAVPTMPSGPPR